MRLLFGNTRLRGLHLDRDQVLVADLGVHHGKRFSKELKVEGCLVLGLKDMSRTFTLPTGMAFRSNGVTSPVEAAVSDSSCASAESFD